MLPLQDICFKSANMFHFVTCMLYSYIALQLLQDILPGKHSSLIANSINIFCPQISERLREEYTFPYITFSSFIYAAGQLAILESLCLSRNIGLQRGLWMGSKPEKLVRHLQGWLFQVQLLLPCQGSKPSLGSLTPGLRQPQMLHQDHPAHVIFHWLLGWMQHCSSWSGH